MPVPESKNVEQLFNLAAVKASLRQLVSKERLEEFSDGGVRMTFPRNQVNTRIAFCVMLIFGLLGGFLSPLLRKWMEPEFSLGNSVDYLAMLCWFDAGLALIVLLITELNGPAKPTVITIHNSSLKVDRWVAGDRIVREYGPADIVAISVDNALNLHTRMDQFEICDDKSLELRTVVAQAMAILFWEDLARFAINPQIQATNGVVKLIARQAPTEEVEALQQAT